MKLHWVPVNFPSIIYLALSAWLNMVHTAAVGGWNTHSDVAHDSIFLLLGFASTLLTSLLEGFSWSVLISV